MNILHLFKWTEIVAFFCELKGGKVKLRLRNPALNNFKAYGWQKSRTYTEGFEVKNLSYIQYIYSLFIGKHYMENKII